MDRFGTLAYEDLWPYKGDYDFNDLVIDYNFEERLDTDENILSIKGRFKIQGILASMRNGFGIELGVPAGQVKNVSGGSYSRGYTVLEASGVESRQAKAVIIVFENANIHFVSGTTNELIIEVEFTSPVTRSKLGYAPYNPFIMSNGERGREVHLPGHPATALAHFEYFGSQDDGSIIGTNTMYMAEGDLPWAIHLPESFTYPRDDVPIYQAYYYFLSWVNSSGINYTDWYLDRTGYRIEDYLFQ